MSVAEEIDADIRGIVRDVDVVEIREDPEIQQLLLRDAAGDARAELRLIMLHHTPTRMRVRARALARLAAERVMHEAYLEDRRRRGDPELARDT